jgi:hypothetical protein
MKHKCPRTRQIPEVAIINKTQGQDFKIYSSKIKVLSHSKDMAKVKVFKTWVKLQGQGHKVKNIWYH